LLSICWRHLLPFIEEEITRRIKCDLEKYSQNILIQKVLAYTLFIYFIT
jgi:hypothetical protein